MERYTKEGDKMILSPNGMWMFYAHYENELRAKIKEAYQKGYNEGRDKYINWQPGVGG